MVDTFTLIIIQIDTNGIHNFFYNKCVVNFKVIKLIFLMNGNISFKVLAKIRGLYKVYNNLCGVKV
jgi:hypothetical protein